MSTDNRFTPATIDENKVRTFSIPLYQRLFSWKEGNVKKLLSDMKEHFEKTPDKQKTPDKPKPYYLGMLTCMGKEVIDGQQRMTVMLLMAIVFRKYYEGWDAFLKNGDRLDFTARSDDREYINRKIEEYKGGEDEGKKTSDGYVNLNMENALSTIENFLKDNFNTNDEQEENKKNSSKLTVEQFVEKVYEKLTFFIAELPSNYADDTNLLNKYFEVMNSAGRNLEQHEILKVNLLKKMNNQDVWTSVWNKVSQMDRPLIKQEDNQSIEDYRNKYFKEIQMCFNAKGKGIEEVKSILEIDNTLKDDENTETIKGIKAEKQDFKSTYREEGSDSIISFEDFLLLVLDVTLKEIFNEKEDDKRGFSFYQKDKLLERFEDKLNDSNAKEKFYFNLLYYRLLLDYYVIRRDFRNGEAIYTLIISDDKDDEKGETDSLRKLRQFQSMLYVSSEFYNWLKPYLLKLAEQNSELQSTEQILVWLKKKDNERHILPRDKEDFFYDNIDRYWFWRLDYYLWENWENSSNDGKYKEYKDAVERYVFRPNRSIEHFYPQNQSKQNDKEWWDDTITNSFGNLAMISSSFNSEQNNDYMKLKFARIEEQIGKKSLQSLKLLCMYIKAKEGNDGWTERKVTEHEEEMIDVLQKSFLTP